jgi:seryl-tRNA synthetase
MTPQELREQWKTRRSESWQVPYLDFLESLVCEKQKEVERLTKQHETSRDMVGAAIDVSKEVATLRRDLSEAKTEIERLKGLMVDEYQSGEGFCLWCHGDTDHEAGCIVRE